MIDDGIANIQVIPTRRVLIKRGEPVHSSTLLLEGFIYRSVDDRLGQRQIVDVYVAGDFVDLDGFHFSRLDHDIVTTGATKIATYDHDMLARMSKCSPHLTHALWSSTLLDAARHREWTFRLGRLGAEARIAHFFCELFVRLQMVGLVQNNIFELPLTQGDLGEATGLTAVHVNRVLRSLRERGLLTFTNRQAHFLDKTGLANLSGFEPHFLNAPGLHNVLQSHAGSPTKPLLKASV